MMNKSFYCEEQTVKVCIAALENIVLGRGDVIIYISGDSMEHSKQKY